MNSAAALALIVQRARQAFGLDPYDVADPVGKEAVNLLFAALDESGGLATAVCGRHWGPTERPVPGERFALDVLHDEDVRVMATFRVDREAVRPAGMTLADVGQLAARPEVEILDIAGDGLVFVGVSDTISDGVRVVLRVEDLRGIGGAAMGPAMPELFKGVRGAVERHPEVWRRAQDARARIATAAPGCSAPMDNADLAEQTAIANYIAGTVPDEWERKPRKADNGPPGASWAATVVDVATGRLQVRWLFSDPAGTDTDPGRRRLNMLATQAVDGLAIEAWGATKRSTRKAQKWEARPPDEDDGADDADAEAENRPQAFGEVAGSPGRGRRRTGRIADPTGEQAVANVLVGGLTERQRQVLELALAGHTQTEIGNQLQLAQSTVSTALSGIQKRIQRSVDISA